MCVVVLLFSFFFVNSDLFVVFLFERKGRRGKKCREILGEDGEKETNPNTFSEKLFFNKKTLASENEIQKGVKNIFLIIVYDNMLKWKCFHILD